MPASMGRPEYPTPVGTYTVLAKERSVIMDSSSVGIPIDAPDGYRLTVDYAVRITSRGLFVHSAPWAVNSLGYENVSHGCISLSPDGRRVVLQHGQRRRPGDSAGKQPRSSSSSVAGDSERMTGIEPAYSPWEVFSTPDRLSAGRVRAPVPRRRRDRGHVSAWRAISAEGVRRQRDPVTRLGERSCRDVRA